MVVVVSYKFRSHRFLLRRCIDCAESRELFKSMPLTAIDLHESGTDFDFRYLQSELIVASRQQMPLLNTEVFQDLGYTHVTAD